MQGNGLQTVLTCNIFLVKFILQKTNLTTHTNQKSATLYNYYTLKVSKTQVKL